MVGRGYRGRAFLLYMTLALLKIGTIIPTPLRLMSWRTGVYAKLKGEEAILGQGKEESSHCSF